MHIKRIAIQGFKTYKNTTIVEDLSPKHNVVVGRNGSGKSNFFAAIRFVLSDAYSHMSREERQSLIHEGSGTVMSAYVEIVFDNTDRRFPIDKDEVTIRRTIGLKKDDYSLDSKGTTRTDMMNLLETAGFSRSNPYYIVPQGRITSLTNAKDTERLQLLKEVAGAKVFETKLKESQKEMTNSLKRKEKIDEMLEFIENRLEDLDLEKDDLKNFEKYNNLKKALEFNIFDRELISVSDTITSIEDKHSHALDGSNDLVQKLEEREKLAKKLQNQISDLNSNRKLIEIDKSENDAEIRELLSRIAELKVKVEDWKNSDAIADSQRITDNETLSALKKSIQKRERKLQELTPTLDDMSEKESTLKTQLSILRAQERTLFSKRGRSLQFQNKAERDMWLRSEIELIDKNLAAKQAERDALRKSQKEKELHIQSVTEQEAILETQLNEGPDSVKAKLSQAEAVLKSTKQSFDLLSDERKALWRDESRLSNILISYDQEISSAQQDINGTMDRSLAQGLESVRRITSQLDLSGVYGTLGELIEVSDKYKMAAEVVGGNSLFNVVVDTDRTAGILMEELTREKAGRVTFMPLNRLKPQTVQYPSSNDCVPLIKKIAFEDYLAPAVEQIFSRTVVCISLERGSQLAQEYSLNSVTLDGDICDRRGVLSGGFREFKKSRIDYLYSLKKWKTEYEATKLKLEEIQQKLSSKDVELNRFNDEISKQRKLTDALENQRDSVMLEISTLHNDKSRLDSENVLLKSQLALANDSIKVLDTQRLEKATELQSNFSQSLSSAELAELKSMSTKIPAIEKELDVTTDILSQTELEYSTIKIELEQNFYPRMKKMTSQVEKLTRNIPEESSELANLTQSLSLLQEQLQEFETTNSSFQEKLEEIEAEISSKTESLRKIDESQKARLRKLESLGQVSEKHLSKKVALVGRRDEINKKIRELGALPEEAFGSFRDSSSDVLLRRLNEANQMLKQYGHVNKKALEQYLTFTKQRDDLVERRSELDTAKSSIEELVAILEQRKENAIVRTFENVSREFSNIFSKLVPAGVGSLIIQKGNDESSESFTGVSISVSFNSKENEQQRIEQLSGGQKSLCAITLILAIQNCDPAPFYLFDEIDANLDAQYRTSVARLIHQLADDGAQFICTTFRPEMLQVADKFFGVTFSDKVSTVSDIDRSEALAFVEGQQQR
ncbi:unnamed protein product [Kuraishia capsulata CBS 1993]|uniref:Structural maintenance of chromosomes protein n=1 Tax=Kuraishia capsulata CBS 1993 TaxID=1382522 RepID=W6MFE7_9ASCO|nr:uncharacterized protein KUCA_T00000251001 [Kuraishia capsulata CBS 1993]CDK24291.1 unnamed protein product [Kuraishia capsulata CBS 1993]